MIYEYKTQNQGADKSLARPRRKQAPNHARDARDFNNIETRDVLKFTIFLQGKTPKEIHAILTETLTCFLPGRANDLSAPLYNSFTTYDKSGIALYNLRYQIIRHRARGFLLCLVRHT